MIYYGSNKEISSQQSVQLLSWKASKGLNTKKAIYDSIKGGANIFLPHFQSKCVTQLYLDGLLLKQYFMIENNMIKHCQLDYVNITTEILFFELCNILDNKNVPYNLGFNALMLPDKKWLLTVIYTLNPQHEMFKKQFSKAADFSQIEMLDIGEVIGNNGFKNVKHPAYVQYIHNKTCRRLIKKQLKHAHKNQILANFHTKVTMKIAKYEEENGKDENLTFNEESYTLIEDTGSDKQERFDKEDSTREDDIIFDSESINSIKSFKSNGMKLE